MKDLRVQQQRKRRTQRIFVGGIGAAVVIIVIIVLIAVLTEGPSKKITASTTTSAAATTSTTGAVTTTTAVTHVSVPLIKAAAAVGCPKFNGTSPHYTEFVKAPPLCINPKDQYTAHMVTDIGTVTIKLLAAQNPTSVNNFVYLSLYHFYDGTEFHRVVTGFVDQGGDPTGTGSGGPGYSFNGGAPKTAKVYTAGALAMANSGSSSSDGSQFFIVVGKGGAELQPLYSYFGQVTAGISVVNKINAGGSSGSDGTPKVIHKILKVTITQS
jgi:cyclophilin family peptidyl-prolyl cis-trans isomerase